MDWVLSKEKFPSPSSKTKDVGPMNDCPPVAVLRRPSYPRLVFAFLSRNQPPMRATQVSHNHVADPNGGSSVNPCNCRLASREEPHQLNPFVRWIKASLQRIQYHVSIKEVIKVEWCCQSAGSSFQRHRFCTLLVPTEHAAASQGHRCLPRLQHGRWYSHLCARHASNDVPV